MLAPATDLVGQPIAFVAKHLEMPENQVPLRQLALDTEDQ